MDQADPRASLAALVVRSGSSYAALSRLIGRNAAYLQQFVTRGTPRRLAEVDRRRLSAFFGVDERVLGADADAPASWTVGVPRLDVAAAAGPGTPIDQDRTIGMAGFDPALIARLGVRPNSLTVIRAAGQSMEPAIADGDELLVDLSDRRIDGRGAIHVLRIDGGVMVKRIEANGQGYRIVSDNPAYPPFETAAVDVIGRVVWLSRALR